MYGFGVDELRSIGDLDKLQSRGVVVAKSQHAILQMVTQFITIIGRYELN